MSKPEEYFNKEGNISKEQFIWFLLKNKEYNINLSFFEEFHDILLKLKDNSLSIKFEELTNEIIPKIKLKDKRKKYSQKVKNTYIEIYKRFSNDYNQMTKEDALNFLRIILQNESIPEDYFLMKNLFKYDKDKKGFVEFNDFAIFYFTTFIDANKIWKHLNILGYNNMLEKDKEIDFQDIINNKEEFNDFSKLFQNFLNISNETFYRFDFGFNHIENIFLKYLNKKNKFENLIELDISFQHFNSFNELEIKCKNIEKLILHEDSKNIQLNNINIIFPNMIYLHIYFKKKFKLSNLMTILRDSNIKELEIYLLKGEIIETKVVNENKIYELNLIRFKIDIKSFEFNYQTFFNYLLNNIHFPCLKEYILNFQLHRVEKLTIEHQNTNFFNSVNYLILNNLINKRSFSFDDFFSMANNLNKIRILQLNLGIFTFEYKNKYKENNYFTLIVNDQYTFANYFKNNIDLFINDKILKFKKINIQGLKKLYKQIKLKENSLDNIIEDENINCCDINLSLNKKEIVIKSLSNLNSIYCDDDIEKTNFFEINIIKNNLSKFQKLKYLNFSIGYIKEFPNDKNLKEDHLYKSLSKLIQNSKNLKSIILRIHPANFNDNIISFYLSLIPKLKKLRTFKLIQNDKYENNNHYLEPIIENENFIRRLKEFEIGNKDYEIKRILDNKKIICGFRINENEKKDIQILNNFEEIKNEDIFKNGIENEEELKRKCKLYYNNDTLVSFKIDFLEEGENIIKIEQKSKIINSNYMFYNCLNLFYLYNFKNNILENISNMFYNCSKLSFLDFSKVKSNNINDMSYMFCNCTSLRYINLANLNTKNVVNMCYLFYNCISLQFLDLSNFNTSNVIDMNAMFFSCCSLKSLDLSNFDTCNVKNMKCMFSQCYKLEYLNISSFYIKKSTDIDSMFLNCHHLKYLDISNFQTNFYIDLEKIFKKISNKCKLICYN